MTTPMTGWRSTRWLAIMAAAASGCACNEASAPSGRSSSQTMRAEKPARRLPNAARSLLRERMELHALAMQALTVTTIRGENDQTQALADAILGGSKLARPTRQAADQLNAQIPELFFTLQDALFSSARALRKAAADGDRDRVHRAHERVLANCQSCHEAFDVIRRR